MPAASRKLWPPNRWPRWLTVSAALVPIAVLAIMFAPDKKGDGGGENTDICDSLADPANSDLTPADWRRRSDFTQRDLYAYVLERCPLHFGKVREV